MITITKTDNDFIYFESTTKLAIKLGASYSRRYQSYRLPINLHTIKELLTYGQSAELFELRDKVENYYRRLKTIKSKKDTIGRAELRPYQRVDAEFLKQRERVGVFNEQRTGKTPMVIVADESSDKRIIICPSGLKLNWQREINAWLPNQIVYVVSGTPTNRNKIYANFKTLRKANLIISYETLRNDINTIVGLDYDTLVVDESHRLRNYDTKQSKAVYTISDKAKKVYALTGTPAVNNPSDVFGIFKLLKPKKYTSYWTFAERYFTIYKTPFSTEVGAMRQDRADEFQSILDIYSVQRKRRDVMKWLPKVNERVIELDLTNVQKKLINEIVDFQRYNGNVIPNAIAQLMRLRQATLHPELLGVKGNSPKLDFVLDYIEDNQDQKIIVFSLFTSFLNLLKDTLGDKAVMLTGEQNQTQKQASVDAIQNGNAKVMLANIVAGGVGWTLDKADIIIFTDVSYNPMDNAQAKDRFIPTRTDIEYGGKEILYLEMSKSIDKSISRLLKTKIDIIKYVNDYGLKSLVNDDVK
jgi:SWI/SNF-related matrix-associated actin-dependent regulator of chromatin subfamily A-like protein 1